LLIIVPKVKIRYFLTPGTITEIVGFTDNKVDEG